MTRTRFRPAAEPLEARDTPADLTPLGGALAAPEPLFGVGADTGGGPHVRVFTGAGRELFNFFAFEPGFTGGVRVATADFTGDGFEDVAVGAGIGGGPRVRVWDGRTGAEVRNFFAFEDTVRDGVFLGAGDVNADGAADLIVGAGPGGAPRVVVHDGRTGEQIRSFFGGDPNLRGGAYVAGGDFNRDGFADIVVGPGRFNPAYINTFDGRTGERIGSFDGFGDLPQDSFDPVFRAYIRQQFAPGDSDVVEGTYFASTADVDGDGDLDLPAALVLGRRQLTVFDDEDGGVDQDDFRPFGDRPVSGLRPIAQDLNGDGRAELIVGSGIGGGDVLILDGRTGRTITRIDAFPGFTGGVTTG